MKLHCHLTQLLATVAKEAKENGTSLRVFRAAHSITQVDVARHYGFSNTMISRMERGKARITPAALSAYNKAASAVNQ